ncbi:Calmodulin-like protein, partial [Globisporangium splendens]
MASAPGFSAGGNQRGMGDDEANRKLRIRAAFDMFDKDKKGCVIQEYETTCALCAYPSEKDIIKKILPEMQEDEPSTFVTYDRFEKKVLEVLYTNEYEPDTDETLLAAFRKVIDAEKKGYIEADVMRELLITKGTPFREKEMETFLSAAKDASTGRIYYEDYIAVLMQAIDPKARLMASNALA